MIDHTNTTLEWQKFTGTVAILPIGSTEQHGDHLPIATDALVIEAFAKPIAQALNAALLPTLPYGNCLEHTGFRGSFGFSPATLMCAIHDLAEEIERQNFRVLVVLNGHGGNFSLLPACRDWNRRDRPLKILLLAPHSLVEVTSPEVAAQKRPEIHAGANETSLMQHLFPELVRDCLSTPLPDDDGFDSPLTQPDLTTFGTGHFNTNGVIGYPALESAALGQIRFESAVSNAIAWIKARLVRLNQTRRYAGAGGIAIRAAIAADVAAINHLKSQANWNQTEADINTFLAAPHRLWVAVHNGAVIGSISAANYQNKLVWLGMLLVDPTFRRLGVGQRLLTNALNSLHGTPLIKLDATPMGQNIYQRLGFSEQWSLKRMITLSASVGDTQIAAAITPLAAEHLATVSAADSTVMQAQRLPLLTDLYERAPHLAWGLRDDAATFCLGRAGSLYTQLGPVIASSPAQAQLLIAGILRHLRGRPVVIDVPCQHHDLLELLRDCGFREQRQFARMIYGTNNETTAPPTLFATLGPEFG